MTLLPADFEVLGPIGGESTVLLVRRQRELLVVKILDDSQDEARFANEVRLSAVIQHPNIIRVVEIDPLQRWFAMRYQPAITLGHLIGWLGKNKLRLETAIAASIGLDILAGLSAVHDAVDESGQALGAVHRDIGPDNILLTRSGELRIIDFGIARSVTRALTSTVSTVVGKLAYMSPEQLRRGTITAASDLYSFGVVFWELVTARQLFWVPPGAESAHMLQRYVPEPPSLFVQWVEPALERVMLAPLQLDPAERPASAQQLANALREACPVSKTPPDRSDLVGEVLESVLPTLATGPEAMRAIAAEARLAKRDRKAMMRCVASAARDA